MESIRISFGNHFPISTEHRGAKGSAKKIFRGHFSWSHSHSKECTCPYACKMRLSRQPVVCEGAWVAVGCYAALVLKLCPCCGFFFWGGCVACAACLVAGSVGQVLLG